MNKEKTENNIFVLKEKKEEANDVVTLKFLPQDGQLFSFRPGQFLMVELANHNLSGISKAYTISSSPGEKLLAITVKKIGNFSGALYDLKIGEKIKTSEPQGFFCLKDNSENIVFLAGGIGITPFYSMIRDFFRKDLDKNISLFYSNRTKNDIAFFEDFERFSNRLKNLKIIHLLTREKIEHPRIKEFRRIDLEILKKYLGDFSEKHYFICGPIGFVNDLWRELKKAGVKEEEIFTEAFY